MRFAKFAYSPAGGDDGGFPTSISNAALSRRHRRVILYCHPVHPHAGAAAGPGARPALLLDVHDGHTWTHGARDGRRAAR